MPDADPAHYVRGQYDGYLDIDGVAPDSTTETYAALRLEIDNWRWAGRALVHPHRQAPAGHADRGPAGVPPPAAARVSVDRPGAGRRSRASSIVKLDPITGIRLIVDAHRADRAGPEEITLDMEFEQEGGEGPTPYEVLLNAAMEGDSAPFTRQDSVEETWRILRPADRASTTRAPICARTPGARRRPTSCSTALAAGMGPWVAS